MLYYTYTVYICYVCLSLKSAFVRTTKSLLQLHNALYNIAESFLHTHTFLKLFPTTAVQQRQHVGVINCCKFFSRLISIFVFDIPQIHSGFSQIFSGYIAYTCTPLATGLLTLLYCTVMLPLMALI